MLLPPVIHKKVRLDISDIGMPPDDSHRFNERGDEKRLTFCIKAARLVKGALKTRTPLLTKKVRFLDC
ncbi:hypothetical protein GMPD_03070 [Geomonas paludis]|uniref:Uncharacterized protein n=1 Tax=Geomonas paludis TaxID=2740185 RepID=A0A6V8MQP2_9BACT|nr:hypothetical protein GMPD_03070 [Geomonas paludis]